MTNKLKTRIVALTVRNRTDSDYTLSC